VRERHIDTYVNDFTLDVGPVGRAAVDTLFERAAQRGVMPLPRPDLFWGRP